MIKNINCVFTPFSGVLDPETWCDGRDADQYPLSLVQPQVQVTQRPPTEKTGGGVALSASIAMVLMSTLLVHLGLH